MKLLSFTLLLLSALFYCYEYVLRISPSVMIPSIMSHFSLNHAGAGWLISLYYFAYTPLQVGVGVIIDRWGAKRILSFSILTCVIGTYLFTATDSTVVAGLGRIFIGLGSAFAYVGALAIANRSLNKNLFTLFAGAITMLGMLGAIQGEVAISDILSVQTWVQVMHELTIYGAILFVVFSLCSLVYNKLNPAHLTRSRGYYFGPLKSIITSKAFIALGTVGALLFLSLDIFAELWGPTFLKVGLGISKAQATRVNCYVFWGWAIGAPLQALFYRLCPSTRMLLAIQALVSAITIAIILLFISKLSPTTVSLLLLLFGIASSAEVLCFTQAVKWVDDKITATAVAVINFFVMLSGMIFQPLVSSLLQYLNGHSNEVKHLTLYSAQLGLAVLPLAAFIAALIALKLPNPKNQIISS